MSTCSYSCHASLSFSPRHETYSATSTSGGRNGNYHIEFGHSVKTIPLDNLPGGHRGPVDIGRWGLEAATELPRDALCAGPKDPSNPGRIACPEVLPCRRQPQGLLKSPGRAPIKGRNGCLPTRIRIVAMPKFTSLGTLLVLAIAGAGAILLLDVFYLRPQVKQQAWAALRERVTCLEQAVEAKLAAEEKGLLSAGSVCAKASRIKRILAADTQEEPFEKFAQRVFGSTEAEQALLTDAAGRRVGSWSAISPGRGDGVSEAAATDTWSWTEPFAKAAPPRDGGLVQLARGIAVFRVVAVLDQADPNKVLGRLWLCRRIGRPLLERIGSSVDAMIFFIPGSRLPGGLALEGSTIRPFWVSGNNNLVTAWPAYDAKGEMLGYFQAELSRSNIQRQAANARRVILITLSLSLGLAFLVIAATHILVTGPVVRLLKRLPDVQAGKCGPDVLTRGLHGEALALARQLESALQSLSVMAKTDQLTGLANRRHFQHVLTALYHHARRYRRPLSLLAIDLDFFKAVNDTGGHELGDEVLKAAAKALVQTCREADLPARIGGDEFCVILPETDAPDALAAAERIRGAFSNVFRIAAPRVSNLTASVGISDLSSVEIDSPDALMTLADNALYMAKRLGRNRVVQAHDLGRDDGRMGDSLAKEWAPLKTESA